MLHFDEHEHGVLILIRCPTNVQHLRVNTYLFQLRLLPNCTFQIEVQKLRLFFNGIK